MTALERINVYRMGWRETERSGENKRLDGKCKWQRTLFIYTAFTGKLPGGPDDM